MLLELFRISGTTLEDAIAHGAIPNHFAGLGADFAGQVHGVLCNNPQQLYSIISYLQAIVVVQSNNDIPNQAYNPQADPHASMPSQVPPFISLCTSSGEFPPELQDITHNNNNGDNFDSYYDYEGEYSGFDGDLSSLGDFPLVVQE
ncbi:hypothetical protein CFIMG_007732RA00001 [Ceratocystis fimbriata CBS 114723]|uniref:Uncharacterized protein n=1 Tax=Ceratocystis fimbriata CBS 114723 TaxID=1035309 RepID=A0A2C5W3G3_9PEZI|nr:hypothetical protein CFIMG_007732RA00001 [Ceratocystis fimbriata CBS 114723]